VDDTYLSLDRDYVLYPQKRIKGICAENGIPVLDLMEPLHAAGGAGLFRDYVHLTGPGNDVVADEVTRYLKENPHLWNTPK
jgi:hypothetical protein